MSNSACYLGHMMLREAVDSAGAELLGDVARQLVTKVRSCLAPSH